ncbi:hypothetical protein [Mariniblastus fucicola]|uniref:Uncharacterized protein n=1 Tax=Mariniblastus fucicola TaxID=980251 RepID=A0A5B9PC19_9BACT|nr:hypothetical protein [Mariniblastus fucicola]QEG20703.1 hypothetical protein MFFC18_05540 [Mariniblastus fucicola]
MNLSQFLALMRLRFQLSLNQIRKGGRVNSILYSIASVGILLFAVTSFVSAIGIGASWMSGREVSSILVIWNAIVLGFLVMWCFYVLNRLQQNDVISIDKLLHLPMTFQGAFLLNYLSTFANFTLLAIAPVMLGLAIAMPIARGWTSAIAIPLTLAFLFMVTAITYQLRSWLAEKMENKRTSGILMAVLPLACIGIFIGGVQLTESRSFLGTLKSVPLGWVPSGIVNAESGNWFSGLLGTLAMSAIGCASLFFAYRSSLRKFTGEESGSARKQASVSNRNWLDSKMFTSLPYVSDPVSVIAMGTMQNLRRAPEVFAAVVPVVVLAVFGSPYLMGWEGYVIPDWIASFLQPGLIAVALLGFPAFLFSSFSYDRDGFRSFILSPVERKDILLGKNIAIGIPTVLLGWITMVVLQCFIPVGTFWFLGSLISLPASYLLLCIVGNAISIFFAVGLKRGSMQPVNARVIPVVALYVGILAGPFLAMTPTWMALSIAQLAETISGFPMSLLYVALALLSLAVSWLLYHKSLIEFGKWLWRKESEILPTVANIPE